MCGKFIEYFKLAVILSTTTVIFIFFINPILLDVAPFLAFQSQEGFDRHPGGFGQITYIVTLVFGVFFYYIVIEYSIESGIMSFIAAILLTLLVLIPNRLLPEKYHPGTIGQQDIEDWLVSFIPFTRVSEDDTE